MVSCIQQKSRSLEETVIANLGYGLKQPLMAPDLWFEDFTASWFGRSYTLKYQETRGNDFWRDNTNLHVNISDGLDRMIFFHDPDFFILSANPESLPFTLQTIQPTTSGYFYFRISLTEHVELSTPQDPCVEEATYSFQGCIKESLSRKIGCRIHWDTISDQTRPVCTTLAQHQLFDKGYNNLKEAPVREIKETTGCEKPCRCKEYALSGGMQAHPLSPPSGYRLSLSVWMATTDITVKTEHLLISPATLVANIGGTLSLFLGISFMTLWDGIIQLENIGKKAKTYFV
jgi:hypothetical protein